MNVGLLSMDIAVQSSRTDNNGKDIAINGSSCYQKVMPARKRHRREVFSVQCGKLEVVHRQLKCLTVLNLKHTGIVENGKRGYWKVSTGKLVSPPVVLQEVEVWMESWWARGI